MSREQAGVLLCLLSAAAFSTSTIFGRIALDDGASVWNILALRYGVAAPLFWLLFRLTAQPLPNRAAGLRVVGFGAVVVAAQAMLIYLALDRLSAGLVVILLYTFPAMVAVGAVAIGREQPSRRKAGAVLTAIVGTVLVMIGGATLDVDVLGVVLAVASAFCAAVWVLISDRLLKGMPAMTVSALMSTGAGLTLCTVGLAMGAADLSFGLAGWSAIVGTILISTIVAISTSLAGVARVGPTVASVLLTAEVPLAVTWSILLLGEELQPLQVVGGALVVAAVLLLQVQSLRWPGWVAPRYAASASTSAGSRQLPEP